MGKSKGNLHCTPPLPIPCSWEAVCWSCSTVSQSSHFITVLQTSESMQVSPFSSMVTESHFSWHAFSNVWKCLLFAGDSFAGVWSIDSAMLSLVHETFLQMSPWFRDLFGLLLHGSNVLFRKLRRSFFCFMSFMHARSASENKSAYFCLSWMRNASKSGFGKFWFKSFGDSQEKLEKPSLSFFYEWQNVELWEAIRISRTPYWFS